MSAPSIDHEAIHDKLMLLGTVAGLMADCPENFGKVERYAMQTMLYGIAKDIWPREGPGEESAGGDA